MNKQHSILLIIFFLYQNFAFCQNDTDSLNIKTDIRCFSRLMSNSDTLIINSDLGFCMHERHEVDIITKENDSVYIQTITTIDRDTTIAYNKCLYEYKPDDTLNFENIFGILQDNSIKKQKATIEIIYNKKDTLYLYTDGLEGIQKAAFYINDIKDRIYSGEDYYFRTRKNEEIPVPPKTYINIQEALYSCFNSDEFDFIFQEVNANNKLPIFISTSSNNQLTQDSLLKIRTFEILKTNKSDALIHFQDITLEEYIAIFDFIIYQKRYSVYMAKSNHHSKLKISKIKKHK